MNCPKCGKSIDHLKNIQSGVMSYDFSLNIDSEFGSYEEDEFGECDNYGVYICPECYQEVAQSEEEALKLLKGG